MRTQLDIRAARTAGLEDISVSALPRRAALTLDESERAILKHWGNSAIENLYNLGTRVIRDADFSVRLQRVGRRDSAEAYALLAAEIPDLLTNAYVLDRSLRGAVPDSFFRGLPSTGREIKEVAIRLHRFDRHELQATIESETSFFPELAKPAVYTQFSQNQISLFGEAQLAAYYARLAIQPGGDEALHALQKSPAGEEYKKFSRIMTVTTLEKIRELGVPTLKLIRAMTQSFNPQEWQRVGVEQLCQAPLLSLTSGNGERLELPVPILEQLRNAHHGAWIEGRALLGNAHLPSVSYKATQSRFGNTERITLNLNSVASLTLAAQIGHLPESLFAKLLESASPYGGIEVAQPKLILTPSESSHQTEAPPSISMRRLEYPEIIQQVKVLTHEIERGLVSADLKSAAPVFREIDLLDENIRGQNFLQRVDMLRQISERRSVLSHNLLCGMLSVPVADLHTILRQSAKDQEGNVLTIAHNADPFWQEAIHSAREGYEEKRAQLRLITEPETPPGFQGTNLLTPTALSERYPDIIDLIERNSTITERGGLLPKDFSKSYFKTFLRQGNYVLIRAKTDTPGERIDGLFKYHQKGAYPKPIAELMRTISPGDDVAYESLFVTAPDRAKGTYMMLLRGMIARQVLAGVRYSMGTVIEGHNHHFDLLKAVNHYPLLGAPVYLDSHATRFIPMLWRLPDAAHPHESE
jgi:hypothetical protein